MNLTVLDHITEGRKVLAEAERIAAQGTTLAMRQALALREAQAIKSQALMGETGRVRSITCPYCGTYSLLLHKGRAQCINRHCAAAGVQRNWALTELMMARPATPSGVRRTTTGIPRDVRDLHALARFFKETGYPVSLSTLNRIVKTYELPRWRHPIKTTTYLYSLSDVLTAHAVHALKSNPSDCAAAAEKPACSGLADQFFSDGVLSKQKTEDAKALCDGCPFKDPCLETALTYPDHAQSGVRGGLSANERRARIAGRGAPGEKTHCPQGHPYSGDNLRIRANGNRACRICSNASTLKSRKKRSR